MESHIYLTYFHCTHYEVAKQILMRQNQLAHQVAVQKNPLQLTGNTGYLQRY